MQSIECSTDQCCWLLCRLFWLASLAPPIRPWNVGWECWPSTVSNYVSRRFLIRQLTLLSEHCSTTWQCLLQLESDWNYVAIELGGTSDTDVLRLRKIVLSRQEEAEEELMEQYWQAKTFPVVDLQRVSDSAQLHNVFINYLRPGSTSNVIGVVLLRCRSLTNHGYAKA